MKIKKLEIQGFKSFVDKVDMSFPNGIITVVGPNGCGKSNVVDAIRWVMGEQSAKHLRGKVMEDIIFNGSEERKPVGMAEVALTFDNSDGIAPADYAEFNEISVSRRLYRSGDSEYYINKLPCRLKDITELFMDTGVGTRAYSIIEQGKVGAIVTMKPEERRSLIEEAAGITKYKSKKNAALRKVDATEQNLLRVKDVMREVRRQINSLERQAKKAKAYKELRAEMREIEISMASRKYKEMVALLASEKEKLNSSIDRESALTASIAEREGIVEEKKLAAASAEESLRQAQDHAYKTSNRIVEFEQKIAFHEKELERLDGEEKRYSEEIVRLKSRLVDLAEQLETLEGERSALSKREEEGSVKLKSSEENYRKLSAEFTEKEKELERAKGEMVHIATMKSNLNNSIVHLGERLADIERRLERKRDERSRSQNVLEESNKRLASHSSSLEALYREKRTLDGSRSSEVDKLKGLKLNADAMEEKIKALDVEIHRKESKLHSLEELKNRYEGLETGVQAIMERHKKSSNGDGILGIVADFIEVPRAYEMAVGAVLDDKLQYVVVKDRTRGMEAIEYLKNESTGRGSFIAAAGGVCDASHLASSWSGSGEPLISKIKVKEGYGDLIETLMGNVLFVSSMEAGLKEWDTGFRGVIVTAEGEFIESSGAITGGKSEGGSFDLLKREREIKEITLHVAEKKKELKEQDDKRLEILECVEKSEKELDQLKRREFDKEIEIANLEKDKIAAEKEVGREEERLSIISMEEEQLSKEIGEFKAEIEVSKEKILTLGNDEADKEKEIRRMQQDIFTFSETVEKVKEELTELRVSGNSFMEKGRRLESEISSLKSAKEETLRLLERDERALANGKERLGQISSDLSTGKEMLDRLLGEHEGLKEELTGKKNAYNTVAEEIRMIEAELKDLHRSHDELNRNTSQLKVFVAEKEMEVRHLVEGTVEKYDIDLVAGSINIPPVEAGAEERLVWLNGKIEEIGEVNLTALEEHKENMERLTFLETQEKDLVEAMESLKRTINRINRTSRQRFKEAFESINEKFKDIFPKLFRGGRAELVLTDENDLLETGVDIIAQPPGKKLQNLNLLSGGEKALTAITLIFSIFLFKPSPFCLLDEVDAPLDDANVGRFNELVREMSLLSQVIMISHNKSTISIGDTLYGVTMEDPGVSKLVSVQLN
ncbi:MAG: chromosome segregation protein SMC [Deltaproteobacteria bacterium]|nr:chromosome segregation protein SMC [Deltaproteobacteria bacterium]